MPDIPIEVGQTITVKKTVSERDVLNFAKITGDFSPNHVDRAYMANSIYGKPIAHGALLVGYISNASTLAVEGTLDADETPVSAGYDKIRFLKPVFWEDCITIRYTFTEIDPERKRSYADITVTNQDGVLVAVSRHILQWIPNP